ncbi:MAG: hypothetical protein M1837_005211 [Sclerophora amabilis]|nr:MAG: hypothetical protein M1837_005211 [Sclerophora amabilis]
MSSQRYERIYENDEDDSSPVIVHSPTPASPPPSFRSRASSPTSRHLLSHDPLASDADRALADSFDAPSDSEAADSDGEDEGDDRQRLMRGTNERTTVPQGSVQESPLPSGNRPTTIERRVTQFPTFASTTTPATTAGRVHAPSMANDGVFANLSAKPEHGEKGEERPPTYEQAAADAAPPYWETTILAPGVGPDEVFIDGLPVGSFFSFVWNGMISMSFQLVGFLLTYLLHTTHAAKNGSKAGLGITLVQYGFYMKGAKGGAGAGSDEPVYGEPTDPNSHDFDPSDAAVQNASGPGDSSSHMGNNDWLAYIFMIVGWFILIRAVTNFIKSRRHEQLVLQSPDRGLNVPIVAEGERAETVV